MKSPRSLPKGHKATVYGVGLWTGSVQQVERATGSGPTPTSSYSSSAPFGTPVDYPLNLWTGMLEYRMGTQSPGLELGMGYDYISTSFSGDIKYQLLGFDQPKGAALALDAEIFVNTVGAYGFDVSLVGGAKAGLFDFLMGGRFGRLANNPYGQQVGYSYYDSSFASQGAYLAPKAYNYVDVMGALEYEIDEGNDLQLGVAYRLMLDQPYSYPGREVTLNSYPYTVLNTTVFDTTFPSMLLFTVSMRMKTKPPADMSKDPYWDKSALTSEFPGSADSGGETHLQAGKSYLRDQRWDLALQEFIQAEAKMAMTSELALGLGYGYYMKQDWESALYYYEVARGFTPGDVRLHQTVIKLRQKVRPGKP
jgi:hypothetical protein